MQTSVPVFNTFCVGRATAAGATAFTQFIPPYRGGNGGPPLMYNIDAKGNCNWQQAAGAFTHLKKLLYTTGTTLHQIGIMRPFNFTYFTSAVAKNTTLIGNAGLALDPGIYSTNYLYQTPGGATPTQVADSGIATGDYVAYQLADGTWIVDIIASGTFGSSLTLTTGTPNRNGATIPALSPLFLFKVIGSSDPATGLVNPQWDTTASTTNENFSDDLSLIQSMHKGDPMIFYSPNTTAAGKLSMASGYYGPF